jgi:hypothetical protein
MVRQVGKEEKKGKENLVTIYLQKITLNLKPKPPRYHHAAMSLAPFVLLDSTAICK